MMSKTTIWHLQSPSASARGIPTASKANVPLLGYQGGTVAEDCSIYASPTVLGRETQPTDAGLTMPFCEVCS